MATTDDVRVRQECARPIVDGAQMHRSAVAKRTAQGDVCADACIVVRSGRR